MHDVSRNLNNMLLKVLWKGICPFPELFTFLALEFLFKKQILTITQANTFCISSFINGKKINIQTYLRLCEKVVAPPQTQ